MERERRPAGGGSWAVFAGIAGATLVALATVIAIAAVTVTALGRTEGNDASNVVRDVVPVLAAFGGAAVAVIAVALGAVVARVI